MNADYEDQQEILNHLEAIESARSDHIENSEENVMDCLQFVEDCGFFGHEDAHVTEHVDEEIGTSMLHAANDRAMEQMWSRAYETRRTLAKKRIVQQSTAREDDASSRITPIVQVSQTVCDQSTASTAGFSNVHNVHDNLPFVEVDSGVIAERWTLNDQQSLAFRIIANRVTESNGEPLRMILSGAGGTGKSRVINALTDMFEQRGEARRFHLASYTGVAAKNINGSTIHSTLNMKKRKRGSNGNNTAALSELQAMWHGVDFLFVDEYSMIGCTMLYDISEALSVAKEDKRPFRGINIIFAGDFAQLPAIGQTRLYARTGSRGHGRQKESILDKTLLGRLLWLSMTTVVILKEVMRRQDTSSAHTIRFLDLLAGLREGKCNDDDFDLLQSRVANRLHVDWESDEWKNCI